LLALVALLTAPAQASLTIRLTDAASGAVLYTNGTNTVVAIQSDVDFTTNVQVATSNSPGGPATLTLSGTLHANNASVALPQNLMIEISDTGFLLPNGPGGLTQTLNTNTPESPGEALGSISGIGYYQNAPATLFCQALGTCTGNTATVSFANFSVGNGVMTPGLAINTVTPFSLDEVINLTFTGPGDALISATLSATVPEPASLVLLGTTLLGLSTLLRKKIASRT
jgi:hypothetical protein